VLQDLKYKARIEVTKGVFLYGTSLIISFWSLAWKIAAGLIGRLGSFCFRCC
jgi:hypothetical protein